MRSVAAGRRAAWVGVLAFATAVAGGGAAVGQAVLGTGVPEPAIPPGVDVFSLTLEQTRELARSQSFELVGHSYLKGDWLTEQAKRAGFGAGFNTVRVHDGIAYLGGYNSPPTVFGALIVDVSDPRNMRPLSFIPCNPGARCPYLRLNTKRKILVFDHDATAANPLKPPAGTPVDAGFSFYDVSDPRNPVKLGHFTTAPNGATHGFEIDDNFVYGCASRPETKSPAGFHQEVVILDYTNPREPRLAATFHFPGLRAGETPDPENRVNPDGTPQRLWCHEIDKDGDRLYVAWRDIGMVILDVSNPRTPRLVGRPYDYVPPYHGGALGAAHTASPVPHPGRPHASLVVLSDEIFECPPGIDRVLDVADPERVHLLATIRLPVDDTVDPATGEFRCPAGQHSTHYIWFDHRTPGTLFYQAWYGQGVRAFDLSNPYVPREVGYYLSPNYHDPKERRPGEPLGVRQTREIYLDPQTNLLYVTDGNGGGLTVLRYTGPLPAARGLPGVRSTLTRPGPVPEGMAH